MEIIIKQNYKNYHLKVDLIQKDELHERYKVYPPQNPDRYFIIQNNRPMIRDKYKLKKRRIDWSFVEGKRLGVRTLEEIYKKIEQPDPPEKPIIFPKVIPNNRKKGYGNGPTLGERKGL